MCSYLLMLFIHLACHQRKRLICFFRLAHWQLLSRTAPYSRISLGVCSVALELSSYLDPWQLGLATLFSIGLQAGSQACRTSWRAKGPPGDLLRLQGSNPWTLEQPTSRDANRAEPKASCHLSLPLEKIYLWNYSFTLVSSIWKGIEGLA